MIILVRTYRFKLMAYSAVLMAFLIGILSYTYFYARSMILNEANLRLTNTTQLLKDNLEMEENELLHYAEIVRDDLRIQEYMFMVVKVGVDSEPLESLYDRHFGWFPVSRQLIVSLTGRILLGSQHGDLAMAVMAHLQESKDDVFYLTNPNGMDIVTWSPVSYQGSNLGFVAMVRTIDNVWLDQHKLLSGGNLIIEHNGVVQLSSIPELQGKSFRPHADGKFHLDGKSYNVNPISTHYQQPQIPRIWYGVAETELLEKLSQHSRLILGLAIAGCLGILGVGTIIIRNFSRPLGELIEIARSVAEGHLPILKTSAPQNEIDLLSNQFAKMLHSLREKQAEVEIVHKELQASAITDSLTNLHNRRYLQEAFPRILGQAQREGMSLTGILLDIDHFKLINDKYGHLGGDECLVHFAKLLRENCRANDFVFRIGGEEFLLLTLNETRDGGRQLGEKIRAALERQPARCKSQIIPMTTSVGISLAVGHQPPDQALRQLLMNADQALYQAKASGRNQVRVQLAAEPGTKTITEIAS